MPHKKILTLCILFFILAVIFLFRENTRELDPNLGKNWWTLSLTFPIEEESLAFTVDNHSTNEAFTYEIMVGKNTIAKESFEATKKQKTTITPPLLRKQSERVKIIVTTGGEKKEVYR